MLKWKYLLMTVLFAILSFDISHAVTSDAFYARAVYRDWSIYGSAWSENTGWLTFSPNVNGKSYLADDGLSGYIYGENIGWVSLSCRNTSSCGTLDYGVLNDAQGNLSGFAWGENIGWIDFGTSTASYQVIITDGALSGYAYGENIGWINFGIGGDSATTTWRARSSRAQCDDGLDNDSDNKIDYPTDTNCSSLTDNTERSSALRRVVNTIATGASSTQIISTTSVVIATSTDVALASTSGPAYTAPQTLPKTIPQDKSPIYVFSRNLKLGSAGEDVRQLQKYLNRKGFIVSTSGLGSIGNESNYYGIKTLQAVRKYQEYYKADILTPLGLRSGTGLFYVGTRVHVNKNNF